MSMGYLTRLHVRRNAKTGRLVNMLRKHGETHPGSAHGLIWQVFKAPEGHPRDFLWREMEPGVFLTLSQRRPQVVDEIFAIEPPKDLAPVLEPGDHLRFSLRANAVVRVQRESDERTVKTVKNDIVQHEIDQLDRPVHAHERQEILERVGKEWIAEQGERGGFAPHLPTLAVNNYQRRRIGRGGRGAIRYATIDFEGVLAVTDPQEFIERVRLGFGASKAFGCGLMLIRRPW